MASTSTATEKLQSEIPERITVPMFYFPTKTTTYELQDLLAFLNTDGMLTDGLSQEEIDGNIRIGVFPIATAAVSALWLSFFETKKHFPRQNHNQTVKYWVGKGHLRMEDLEGYSFEDLKDYVLGWVCRINGEAELFLQAPALS